MLHCRLCLAQYWFRILRIRKVNVSAKMEYILSPADIKEKSTEVVNRRQEKLEEAKNREHTHYGQHHKKH